MEEIEIAIDVLKQKKSDLQILMAKPFEYGRWPNDNEFSEITFNGVELGKVEAQIFALVETLECIKINARAAPALLEALDSARAFIFRHAQSDCNTGELICKKTEAELIKIDAAIAAARGEA